MNTPNDGGKTIPDELLLALNGTNQELDGYLELRSAKEIRSDIKALLEKNASEQIGLRDYFIAHAPAEPQPWFTPKFRPWPEPSISWKWCEACRDGEPSLCREDRDCGKFRVIQDAQDEWKLEFQKQRYIQWPAAWADAMLAERQKKQ